MIITKKAELDLRDPGMAIRMDAVQNDCYTRCLEIALLMDGVPWIVPEGTLIGIRYRKQDMTGGYYDRLPSGVLAYDVHENVVTVMLAPQMMTVPGVVVAQLELMNDTRILATGRILLNVEENPAAGVVTSEDYMNWGQWMEERLQKYLQEVLDSGVMVGPAGIPAQLISTSVVYQSGTSGTEVPQGTWSEEIPQVKNGDFLWTKTVYTFNSGEPVVQYSVCKSGNEVVSTRKIGKMLYAEQWSDDVPYQQSVTIEDFLEQSCVCVYPEMTANNLEEKLALDKELGKIRWCTRNGNVLTFECLEDRPSMDIAIIAEVYV